MSEVASTMANVTAALVQRAIAELGVVDVAELNPGAQKAVRHVQRNETDFAMKVIAVPSSHAEAMRRAEREVELLAGLDSEFVVKVHDSLVELGDPLEGAAWLEELLDGDDLRVLLHAHRWAWIDTAEMAQQVADGLGSAHAKGVVHRDLSPNNIRRTADGTYKVMDFGFARFTLRSGLTVAGQPGTPGYMSPEHLNSYSGGPTAASDVFVLGLLMYSALTAEMAIPYRGDDADYIRRLQACQMTPIRSARPDLSDDQLSVLERCLHPQPARRFRNGWALRDALEAIDDDLDS